ncbi:hypothetical protein [uncultured Halomonas sp.]|uniref:hypothetical protein n=1 Tax=uncultured Halomonas sp. TaxID=173971 RepID=UPI002619598B|nr:hypothetical protein [uncultured Halomonas sp.]
MSKAVKSVGRSVKKVVKGAGKVVSKVAKGAGKVAKKVWDNPIGRVALVAAGAYFGAPAVMGLFGKGAAAATGLSGLSGAMANITNAWSGLSSATGAMMSGQFGEAARSLSGGLTGATSGASAGSHLSNVTAQTLGGAQPAGIYGSAAATPAQGGGLLGNVAASHAAPPVSGGGGGLLSRAMGAAANSPYTVPMAMQMGGNMLSGVAEQRAMREQMDREEQMSEEERERYNRNVGTRLWTSRY